MTLIDIIVVPQGAEYQAVCRGLNQAQAESIVVIPIPIGSKNLSLSLAQKAFQAKNPQNVVIMGLCGSLSPKYVLGDPLIYQSCGNLQHQQVNLAPELNQLILQKISAQLVRGLTSDRLINLAAEKLQLSQVYSATAIEMEGYDYIRELQARGFKVAMVRVVSDDLKGDLPDLNQAIDKLGKLRILPLAIAFCRQPMAALRLIQGSLKALKVLEQLTERLTA